MLKRQHEGISKAKSEGYRASELIPCEFDEKLATWRFHYLAQKGGWLAEGEVLPFVLEPTESK